MENIYIVKHYDSYQNNNNPPTRRGFINRKDVVSFLKEKMDEHFEDYKIDEQDVYQKEIRNDRKECNIKEIENELLFNLNQSWGTYKYETEIISTVNFE